MSKQVVVYFKDSGARVLVNPENIERYKNDPRAIVNPNLELVKNKKLHEWTMRDFGIKWTKPKRDISELPVLIAKSPIAPQSSTPEISVPTPTAVMEVYGPKMPVHIEPIKVIEPLKIVYTDKVDLSIPWPIKAAIASIITAILLKLIFS